jgi:hypothetical protein
VSGSTVAARQAQTARRPPQFLEELSKPAALSDNVGDDSIFCFRAGSRHSVLPLRRPRHQIVADEDAELGGGATGVGEPCPIGVRVGDQVVVRRVSMQSKPEVSSATEVAQDALQQREMGVARGVHEHARLLDDIGDVGSCQRQVLEAAGEAPVVCRVRR